MPTDQLVESLRKENVPDNANLYWAGNRPDGRLTFYWNRPIRQVVDPYKLMAEQGDKSSGMDLRMQVADRICSLLNEDKDIYMVLHTRRFQFAEVVL